MREERRVVAQQKRYQYIEGNTVRKQMQTEYAPEVRKTVSHTTQKNRDRARHMNLGYVAFLSLMLLATMGVLILYINLNSQVKSSVTTIARKQAILNELKVANDEEYTRIVSSVDLEEIKYIATHELGMHYANEGQIETFSSEDSDYVRQLADIPKE